MHEGLLPANLYLVTFIMLRIMLAIWKIYLQTRSNGKQNIQFQNRID